MLGLLISRAGDPREEHPDAAWRLVLGLLLLDTGDPRNCPSAVWLPLLGLLVPGAGEPWDQAAHRPELPWSEGCLASAWLGEAIPLLLFRSVGVLTGLVLCACQPEEQGPLLGVQYPARHGVSQSLMVHSE